MSPKLVVVFVALFAGCLGVVVRSHHSLSPQQEREVSAVQTGLQRPSDDLAAPRKVFPLSVIHGGAYTQQELERARRTDAVVAAHYADFGARPKFQKLPHDALMYVSYRRSNQVYWSKVRHRIPQGETVISDGTFIARARCGNRLSATPQGPVAPKGPTEEVLSTLEAPDTPVSYTLAELPGPEVRPFPFYLPSFEAGTPTDIGQSGIGPAAAGVASSSPGSSSAGGPGGSGGLGPLATSGGTRQPAPVIATTSLLPVSTTAGSSLPTSPTFPSSGPAPISAPGKAVAAELVPEPNLSGYLILVCLIFLTRRSGFGFLRGQVG